MKNQTDYTSKLYAGIDPGKRGAIAILDEGACIIEMFNTPMLGKEYDVAGIREVLSKYELTHIAIERVNAIQGRVGGASNFNFGQGYGLLQGLVAGLQIPYTLVGPKIWQKLCWLGVSKQDDNKKTSLLAARRLYPKETFLATQRSKVPHDGLVDAALIAHYCVKSIA